MSTELTWFKSSYSNSGGGECLEVAHSSEEFRRTVHVRDSKLGARSPRFAVPADVWNAFLDYAAREA
ncbi:DUF397 domain-containing protein [Streptomyces sp. NPDC003753]|uniref:DUF397 domain-containing protein n=1 Tax=unclassified Streptomyces TaxID=2593676 RepID=UPI001904AE8F|nr:DUF397 domain-containing protein [Streptomyces sp. Y2F8-2]GHJ99257.1 hypothetical protein SY2F82_10550 [Streptomyces sp. Y2F8-2]